MIDFNKRNIDYQKLTFDFDKIISHINYDKNILEYLFSFYKKNVSIK